MTEKEKLQAIFEILCKFEIKGSSNILNMYNLMSFIQKEIDKIDAEEKLNLAKIKGG